jgi:endonuclease/exonuclease/phosphatase family metal-dependent hydrolase
MQLVKNVLVFILTIVLLIGLYIGGNLLYATLTDYKPDPSEILPVENMQNLRADTTTFTFLIWNIGYAGLGAQEDFFYDGGKSVIAPEKNVREYLECIKKFLQSHAGTDFILLQEIDRNSRRSYFNDQLRHIAAYLPQHGYTYARNYLVDFIPVPYLRPMGKVDAGLGSYARYRIEEAMRYQLPGSFPWPKRIYFLDRCILTFRIKLTNGKELIVINLHNSAYDDTGELKAQELAFIKEYLLKEYEKGNYIVAGGDWNQTPPRWNNRTFTKPGDDYLAENISPDFLPGWQWAYDASVPTNRNLKGPYDPNTTSCTVIDFYLVSPNLNVEYVRTHDLQFACSDHQPVSLRVSLR